MVAPSPGGPPTWTAHPQKAELGSLTVLPSLRALLCRSCSRTWGIPPHQVKSVHYPDCRIPRGAPLFDTHVTWATSPGFKRSKTVTVRRRAWSQLQRVLERRQHHAAYPHLLLPPCSVR